MCNQVDGVKLLCRYESLDFPVKLNYPNLIGTAETKHTSNHRGFWINQMPYTHLKTMAKTNSFVKPISCLQPAERHFAGVVNYQIKGLQTKQRDIFKDSFPERNGETKISELRRETVLSRLEVLCEKQGRMIFRKLKNIEIPCTERRHTQLAAHGNSLLIALWSRFCFLKISVFSANSCYFKKIVWLLK